MGRATPLSVVLSLFSCLLSWVREQRRYENNVAREGIRDPAQRAELSARVSRKRDARRVGTRRALPISFVSRTRR